MEGLDGFLIRELHASLLRFSSCTDIDYHTQIR